MLKIALIGYGKMGQIIEKIAPDYDVEIVAKIDPIKFGNKISDSELKNADVCIDFTTPDTVLQNIKELTELQKNIVVGTTGWHSEIENVKKIVSESNIGFIYSSNFSLGMNIFFKIVDYASKLVSKIDNYDIYGLEKHHKNKLDSPSGTAKMLTDIVLKNSSKKNVAQYDRVNRKIKEEEFHFASIRAGSIFGEHTIGLDSAEDSITLSHNLKNRNGLAIGAILAAKWIADKKGFYNFSEIFEEIIL